MEEKYIVDKTFYQAINKKIMYKTVKLTFGVKAIDFTRFTILVLIKLTPFFINHKNYKEHCITRGKYLYFPTGRIEQVEKDFKVTLDLPVKSKIMFLDFVPIDHKIEEIECPQTCRVAVDRDCGNIQHVQNQTYELCEFALNRCPNCIGFVKDQTDELCKLAILRDSNSIANIRNQTEELCKLAISRNPNSIAYIRKPTEELCELAIRKDIGCLKYIQFPSPKILELVESLKNQYYKDLYK